MKLLEAKRLIDKLVEMWPDQEIRLTFPMSDHQKISDEIRELGYFTHWEGSAHADSELVVKDKCDENFGLTWSETPSS